MNKYQEALDWVRDGNDSCGTEWDALQELIDEADLDKQKEELQKVLEKWKGDN